MKKLAFLRLSLTLCLGLTLLFAGSALARDVTFKVTSPQLKGKQMSVEQVYSGFGCSGKNLSPELTWKDAPKGTKSFAVTAYDPDAPTVSGWWHWVVFNIPATVNTLPMGAGSAEGASLPAGAVQSVTDFGTPGFGGACPPEGDKAHRYIFTVYALNTEKLDLDAKAMPALVSFMINNAKIAQAKVTGKYSRPAAAIAPAVAAPAATAPAAVAAPATAPASAAPASK